MTVYLPLKRCQQTETGNYPSFLPSFLHPFTVGIQRLIEASELDPIRSQVIREGYWTWTVLYNG
ncbi:uncharacterized protein BO66DRAFT_394771 [Aspergillus aculeatinus CBS 121060]|uniref:Uncharacterized protein n=1 Tax=Aspergillus aculeatinus CBS 121060 TaxID=1448322 RepID=A0ACD1GY88_9EURO|nr:hypothetical protein BO66DRAFT_394771 [Aspergillus aculeatinus CBS 121060]RAH66236.1 hypothetical protein BO66DRAFT_394771 [Aspergillus aculeatinus CBS 121060]